MTGAGKVMILLISMHTLSSNKTTNEFVVLFDQFRRTDKVDHDTMTRRIRTGQGRVVFQSCGHGSRTRGQEGKGKGLVVSRSNLIRLDTKYSCLMS